MDYTLGHLQKYERRPHTKTAVKTFFWVVSQITLIGYLVGNAGPLATDLISNAYSREYETAADLEGARLLGLASRHWTGAWRPEGCGQMAASLEVLRRHSGDHGWADYLGTHPALPKSITAVRAFCDGRLIPSAPDS